MAMALYKHWFVDFGPFQDGEFVESELGMIPKGWEVKRLDEIITVKRGGSPRPIGKNGLLLSWEPILMLFILQNVEHQGRKRCVF
jgi:restriction endonuclease S subunit